MIKVDPPSEKSKAYYLGLAMAKGSPPSLVWGKDSKMVEVWESFVVHKMEVSRPSWNGCCRLGVARCGRGTSYVTA